MNTSEASARAIINDSPKLRSIHDERVLRFFSRSIKATEVPVLGVIAAITVILYLETDGKFVWVWLTQALIVQIPRLYLSFRIVDPNAGSMEHRIKLAILLAFIGGVSFASVAVYAHQMSLDTKAVIAMVLTGTAAGSFANTHGYKPIYLAFVVPIFLGILAIWFVDGVGEVNPIFHCIPCRCLVQR